MVAVSGPYAEILRALQILTPPGGIFEVRALDPWTARGYYDSDHLEEAATAIDALDATREYAGIYVTLNPPNRALLARCANRIATRLPKKASSTGDDDIVRRRWFIVDVDPARPSGISSTDGEHEAALEATERISRFLTEYYDFPAPIRADSGNGAHLLYRIDLPNDQESLNLIDRCLAALAAMFDRDRTEDAIGWDVDPQVSNASRISKLYGTVCRKGDDTPERPHRRSKLLSVPDEIEVVSAETLRGLAARAPEEETQPADRPRSGGCGPGIVLDEWLREHGASLPAYHAKSRSKYQTFYEFEVCPWDPAHRDRSAWVGQLTSGALDSGCHHKGCHGRKWHDLRDLVEPKRPKTSQSRITPTARVGNNCPPATTPSAPTTATTPATEATDPLEALYDVSQSGRITIRYPRVAALVHEEMHTISFNDTLYVYEDGMYSEDKGRISARVKEILETIGYDGPMSTVRREVLAYLLAEDPQPDYPFNHVPWHLSVKNGVIQVDPETYEVRLVPHSPKFAFSYQLPVAYDPVADATFIRQVFEQWVEPEDVPYLLHPPAVAILQSWGIKQKQAFLFEGSHDGGKTTYCEFLYGFFGAGTYSQVDLHRLGEDRFALADLEHKMANIHDEMRAVAVRSAEIFKNLTGGLYHRIERKHENGRHVTLPAVHMFTCNRPPKVDDLDDDAFWSRWVYVVFPNQFPRDDAFKATLCTDANQSAFLNTVLNLVVAVMKDPRALQRMDADEVKQRWTMAADATIKFLWAHFERDATATIPKEEVYAAYLRHCQGNGFTARALSTFSADLNRAGIVGVRPRRGKDRVQAYQGIRWKSDSPLASSGQGGQGISNLMTCEKKEGTCNDHIRINNVGCPPDHPDQPPSADTTVEADPGGQPLDKAKVKYSPDPADYADLRRIEFNQRCAACDKQGVAYREKALPFTVTRGTRGLCGTCYEALVQAAETGP